MPRSTNPYFLSTRLRIKQSILDSLAIGRFEVVHHKGVQSPALEVIRLSSDEVCFEATSTLNDGGAPLRIQVSVPTAPLFCLEEPLSDGHSRQDAHIGLKSLHMWPLDVTSLGISDSSTATYSIRAKVTVAMGYIRSDWREKEARRISDVCSLLITGTRDDKAIYMRFMMVDAG
jgi:hypothetical protein